MQELNGTTWFCGGDQMTYHFTRIENTLYSMGANSSNTVFNVGVGTIHPEDSTIIFQWADTPNSKGFGNHGICFFDASQKDIITKKAGSPGFGIGTDFKRTK